LKANFPIQNRKSGLKSIALIGVLVNELEVNEVELLFGIAEINQQIQEIDDTVRFLKLLGETLNIIDRIVQLLI
jgi:hypothetical protein